MLSLLLCSMYLQYLGRTILLRTRVLMYLFMISRTKYTKNILVGSPAILVRDEIHSNKYSGTRRVMNVGYPGSKISTRFNPTVSYLISKTLFKSASRFFFCFVLFYDAWYQQVHSMSLYTHNIQTHIHSTPHIHSLPRTTSSIITTVFSFTTIFLNHFCHQYYQSKLHSETLILRVGGGVNCVCVVLRRLITMTFGITHDLHTLIKQLSI